MYLSDFLLYTSNLLHKYTSQFNKGKKILKYKTQQTRLKP